MPDGQPSTMIMTLGYDPQRGRYIGTFIGSMMSHLWVYEGQLDPSGNILTLDTVGPSFQSSDQMVRFQDVIEFKSPDHRTLTARMLTADNQWQTFMTVHYRRKD
jgi:hypothetical protein